MSKYEPLKRHLAGLPAPTWRTNFREIERILGFTLPPSSRRHRALWSNNPQNHVMTKAWLSAGWLTEQVDLDTEELVFRKVGPGAGPAKQEPSKAKSPFAGLRGTVRIRADVDVTGPAGEEWSAEQGVL